MEGKTMGLVGLDWMLYPVMAMKGIRTAAELKRRLDSVGMGITSIHLSRLMSSPPKHLSIELLRGLLTVLECEPNDLLRVLEPGEAPRSAGAAPVGRPRAPRKEKIPPPDTPRGPRPSNVAQFDPSTGPKFRSFSLNKERGKG